MGLEEPDLRLTRRQALTGLGGLGAAALLVTGCAARDPAGHALTTAAGVAYVAALTDPLSDQTASEVYAFQA